MPQHLSSSATTPIDQQAARLRALGGAERSPTPPVPRSAKIELRTGCDLACSFCSVARHPRAARVMEPSLFRRIAADLRASGVERLGLFYMNEPFLDDGLAQSIRIAKAELGFPYVFLTSNGLAATQEKLRECFEAGLDSLKFALNFSAPEQMASAQASAHAHASIVAHVQGARAIRDEVAARTGHYCRLSGSSLEYGHDQRETMAPLLARLARALDEHYWLPLFGRDDWAPGAASAPASASRARLLPKPVPCWTLFTEAHVRADAELSACGLDASARFAMGNLRDLPFVRAWHSPAFQALRAAHLGGELAGSVCARCLDY